MKELTAEDVLRGIEPIKNAEARATDTKAVREQTQWFMGDLIQALKLAEIEMPSEQLADIKAAITAIKEMRLETRSSN